MKDVYLTMDHPISQGSQTGLEGGRNVAAQAVSLDMADVFLRFETPLLRYVGKILGRGLADTEEVVQETFLRFCRQVRGHGAESIQNLASWLFRVAHNLAMDSVRKRDSDDRARETLAGRPREGDDLSGLAAIEHRASCEKALAELEVLPESQRHVIFLKIIQGLTLREISEVTGLSVGNVDYRINQGLQELAKKLKKSGVI